MNALQRFISARPYGFLREGDLPELIKLDRLAQVLVRCNGCRFICAAQDCSHIIAALEAAGDCVRDVSFPDGALEDAANWRPETPIKPRACPKPPAPTSAAPTREPIEGRDWICTGNFDGNTCGSDADSGL